MKKALWLVPEKSGGIRTYAERLHAAVRVAQGHQWSLLEPIIFDPSQPSENAAIYEQVAREKPDLIHIQHEYGCFGKKYPFLSHFQSWLKPLRASAPQARVIVTAHTVIGETFSYGNALLDHTLLPLMRPFWKTASWKNLDGAIVHSRHQVEWIELESSRPAQVIPHFAPAISTPRPNWTRESLILLFGYFSREKGQLEAIEAMKYVKSPLRLIMIGSVRRAKDQVYFDACVARISELGLQDRCEIISKYASFEELDDWYDRATLVLAPFISTTGSGSLVEAFSRRGAVIASDLLLNQEINERIPGCLELFRTADSLDCAKKIDDCYSNPEKIDSLRKYAEEYSHRYSLEKTAQAHWEYYGQLIPN